MDKKETLIFNKVEIEGFPSIGQVVEKMHQKMYNERKGLGFTNITAKNGAKPPTKNGDTRSLFYHPVLFGGKDTIFSVLNCHN